MSLTVSSKIVLFCAICGCAAINNRLPALEFHVTDNFKSNEFTKAVKGFLSGKFETYFSATNPEGFYTCTQKMTIVRCLKIFLLQRLENNPVPSHTGDLTNDLISQFVLNNNTFPRVTDKKYSMLTDFELTMKLKTNLAKFFKARIIKFHYADVLIKIIPSNKDKINMAFKKGKSEMRSHKTYKKIVEVAVPVMLMPAVLLGTFLPYILPTLKAAAIVSTLINNGALLAALLYAAKNSAPNNEEAIHYSYPGYH